MSDLITEQRKLAVAYARSLLDVKWRHQGRKPWAVDCVGLVYLSLQHAGVNVDDQKGYGRSPWNENLQQKLRQRFGEPLPEGQWQIGDIAVFKSPKRGPSHIGLLADYLYGGFSLIHSHVQNNVAEHALDERWRKLLVEVYSPWAI